MTPSNVSTREDLEALRDNVRSFLEIKSPSPEVRRLMATDDGYDRDVWFQMADQLGLQGLAIPEEFGGSGYGITELLVVFEELGRFLYCGPYFATVALASNVLVYCDDEGAKSRYLPEIASGKTIATVALAEQGAKWGENGVTTRATANSDGTWSLVGEKTYVIDGTIADVIIVPAVSDDGVSVFIVEGDATGLSRSPLDVMDGTRKQAHLRFENTPANLVGVAGRAWPIVAKVQMFGAIALAGEQVGGAQKVLAASVEYAKTRQQFGRFIGSFQAIKHKCADIYLETESAAVLANYAAWALDTATDDAPIATSIAKAYCSEAFTHAAAENIQIHGGVGFTWENDAHLYLRRAKTSEMYLGDPTFHRDIIAQELGI